jgi:acetyl esterase/lipase
MSPLYDAVCRRFCQKIGAVVVSVDYRLSPEHRYPAPYDDGMEVLRYLDSGEIQSEKVMEGIKLDSSSFFLMGDSAGANIAHHVAHRLDAGRWILDRDCFLVLSSNPRHFCYFLTNILACC